MQWAQRLVKDAYGNNYAETHPKAVALKKQIYKVFDAKTKKTVNKRYRKVMALKEEYVVQMPQAQRIFDHLFELTYRFTPFAKDNRPVKGRELDIRGRCPLELAGYDISQMPIAHILRGQLLGWPPETLQQLVPNV